VLGARKSLAGLVTAAGGQAYQGAGGVSAACELAMRCGGDVSVRVSEGARFNRAGDDVPWAECQKLQSGKCRDAEKPDANLPSYRTPMSIWATR
jgi:hypothetical protein